MHDCPHHKAALIDPSIAHYSLAQFILYILFIGLSGSFTHCIGMCGPFAIAQMSARLIGVDANNMSQMQKFKCAVLTPYYIGKSISYSILTLFCYFIKDTTTKLLSVVWFKYFSFAILCFASLMFFLGAVANSKLKGRLQSILIPAIFIKLAGNIRLSTYGVKGLLVGMALGLIPCGFLYGNMLMVITNVRNFWIGAGIMFLFGLTTVVGLFAISYFGSQILTKYKIYLNILFKATMILNSVIMANYAIQALTL